MWDHYHQKCKQSRTCIHQKCPNKYVHSLDLWDTIENSSGTLQNSQALDTVNSSASKIWVDTCPSQCFPSTQGISHPSTNITLPKSKEMVHSLHRYIRWCLWSKTISGTLWNGIPNSLPFTHLPWHTMEMEHHRTRSLELLSSGNWNNSMQWLQTNGKIS